MDKYKFEFMWSAMGCQIKMKLAQVVGEMAIMRGVSQQTIYKMVFEQGRVETMAGRLMDKIEVDEVRMVQVPVKKVELGEQLEEYEQVRHLLNGYMGPTIKDLG